MPSIDFNQLIVPLSSRKVPPVALRISSNFSNKTGNYSQTSTCRHVRIDHFKVTDAILQGVQNYWDERKIYSECIEKVGSFDDR